MKIKIRMNILAISLLILASLPNGVFPQWVQTGGPIDPTMFGVHDFVCSGDEYYLYNTYGIFLSSDQGVSWKSISEGLPERCNVRCLAVRGDTVVAGTSMGFALSTDKGTRWRFESPTPSMLRGTSVYGCIVRGPLIVVGTNEGIFRSTNFGGTWAQCPISSTLTPGINCLAADDEKVVASINVVSAGSSSLYISSDSGATWNPINNPVVDNNNYYRLHINGGSIFAFNEKGFHRSTDNGTSWTKVSVPVTVDSLLSAFSIVDSTITVMTHNIYAHPSIPNKIHLSTDNGTTWVSRTVSDFTSPFNTILCAKSVILAGWNERGGIVRSSDQGISFATANAGITISSISCIMATNNVLIAGTSSIPNISTNNGSTWKTVVDTLFRNSMRGIIGYETGFLASTGRGLVSSADNGVSWRSELSPTLSNTTISFITKNAKTVYLGYSNGQMFASTDTGASWVALNTIPGSANSSIIAMAFDETTIYAATQSQGVHLSIDQGASWQPANYGLSDLNTRSLLLCEKGLFVGTSQGIFLSTDKGQRWRTANDGLPAKHEFSVLAAKGTAVFTATTYDAADTAGTIFCLGENGRWRDISANTLHHSVTAIAFNDSLIFAGTKTNGVYYQCLAGIMPIRPERILSRRTSPCIGLIATERILTVNVTTDKTSQFSLSLYLLSGRKKLSMFNGKLAHGTHAFRTEISHLTGGIYLIVLEDRVSGLMTALRFIR